MCTAVWYMWLLCPTFLCFFGALRVMCMALWYGFMACSPVALSCVLRVLCCAVPLALPGLVAPTLVVRTSGAWLGVHLVHY